MSRLVTALLVMMILAFSATAGEPLEIKLWPGKAPGETKELPPEGLQKPKDDKDTIKRLANVSEPTIAIYAPPKDKANGTAVIVAPGGGYNILAIEHEGTDVCEWLNSLGVTAVLLKYRVPRRAGQTPDNLAMIQDAQRAISLVRSMQTELKIDPKRVGMLGFSAGGHLTACACLTKKRMYDGWTRPTRFQPHEPNFGMLVYPGGVIDKGGDAQARVRGEEGFAADVLRALIGRRRVEREQRRPLPRTEEEQGARGVAPLFIRRSRLRHAQDRPPVCDLARSRGGLDDDHAALLEKADAPSGGQSEEVDSRHGGCCLKNRAFPGGSMRFHALATDYDGTIAHHGKVDEATLAALERAQKSGRRLVLVTGRELPDLLTVFPRIDLFDLAVMENGATDLRSPHEGNAHPRRAAAAEVRGRTQGPRRGTHFRRPRHRRHLGAAPGRGAQDDPRLRPRTAGDLQQGCGDGPALRREQGVPVWSRRWRSWGCRRTTPSASAMPRTTTPSCACASAPRPSPTRCRRSRTRPTSS